MHHLQSFGKTDALRNLSINKLEILSSLTLTELVNKESINQSAKLSNLMSDLVSNDGADPLFLGGGASYRVVK